MTLNDLEWQFYVQFSLLRTALAEFILHTYRRGYLYHVTSGDVRKWIGSAEYLKSGEGLRILRRRYIVGTLINKVNLTM